MTALVNIVAAASNVEAATARLTTRLSDLETAADLARETIDQQRRDIIDLRGIVAKRNAQLGKVRENIANLFTLADRVEIPTILIRDFCETCGLRYLPRKAEHCSKCGGELQRNVSCPFDQPLADLISEDITPDTFASLIADVALGVSVITQGEGDTLRIVAKEGR